MPVQPIRVKRGGIEKTGEVGSLPGKSRASLTTVEPQEPFDLPKKEAPVFIGITLDRKNLTGEAVRIVTTWAEGFVTPSGALSEIKECGTMLTNAADLADFANMFAGAIMRFCINGKVRALEGHNDKPVFDATGALITTYTEEQENEPPTGGYYPPPVDPEPTEPA